MNRSLLALGLAVSLTGCGEEHQSSPTGSSVPSKARKQTRATDPLVELAKDKVRDKVIEGSVKEIEWQITKNPQLAPKARELTRVPARVIINNPILAIMAWKGMKKQLDEQKAQEERRRETERASNLFSSPVAGQKK